MSELVKALVVLAIEDGEGLSDSLTSLLAAAILIGRDAQITDEAFLRMVGEMLAVRAGAS